MRERFCLLALTCYAAAALAASPVDVYQFPSTELETRYYALIDEFRCPKCLNTNLSGSDAPIARDLRRTVHRLLVREHLSDQQIRDFLRERYGDFVLYDPPFHPGTWILWLAPAAFLGVGALVWLRMLSRQPVEAVRLSEADKSRLAAIVGEHKAS
jgi:cytochrome c-type biogenesis protein CcmH